MLTAPDRALEELSALLADVAGLRIAPDGYHGLRLALRERMPKAGAADAVEYVRRLRAPGGEAELRALLPWVTVAHTEFFRDRRQFLALESTVLPGILERARAERRRAAIWSAGCATGEEPYSLAMLLADAGVPPEDVDLRATDVNAAAIESARQGRFGARRMAQVAPDRARRYFERVEGAWTVSEEIRRRVRFEASNLADPLADPAPGTVDLILCRNVIIYFEHATIQRLMERFYAALRPDAYLVLGYSESLFRMHERFELAEIQGAFLYRRPFHPRPAAPATTAPAPRPAPPVPSAAWPEPIAQAPQPAPPLPPRPREAPVREAAQRMERGDFAEALMALEAAAHKTPDDVEVWLTLGNLYALMARADDAQRAFDEVLAREPVCVDAHVYGAMAAMQARAWERARRELGRALFLEPSLALSHYLAAEVASRLGDRAAARRSYRNALAQLLVPQRPLSGFCPDLPEPAELGRAARYALSALEEEGG